MIESQSISYALFFSDPDGQSCAVTAQLSNGAPLPSFLNFDGDTFSGTPSSGDIGSYSIDLTLTDGFNFVYNTITLTVNTYSAPAFATSLDSASFVQGTAATYNFPSYSSPVGLAVTLSAVA